MTHLKGHEWAYAGFTITLISAFVAHVSVGDSADKVMAPVIAAVLLGLSYAAREKTQLQKNNSISTVSK